LSSFDKLASRIYSNSNAHFPTKRKQKKDSIYYINFELAFDLDTKQLKSKECAQNTTYSIVLVNKELSPKVGWEPTIVML
jgi:DNA primase catalytic subunit